MKRSLFALAGLVIFFACVLNATRLMTLWLNQHHAYFETVLSHFLSASVQMQSVQMHWHYITPVLVFNHVYVENRVMYQPGSSAQHIDFPLMIDQVSVGIHWWQGILNWRLPFKKVAFVKVRTSHVVLAPLLEYLRMRYACFNKYHGWISQWDVHHGMLYVHLQFFFQQGGLTAVSAMLDSKKLRFDWKQYRRSSIATLDRFRVHLYWTILQDGWVLAGERMGVWLSGGAHWSIRRFNIRFGHFGATPYVLLRVNRLSLDAIHSLFHHTHASVFRQHITQLLERFHLNAIRDIRGELRKPTVLYVFRSHAGLATYHFSTRLQNLDIIFKKNNLRMKHLYGKLDFSPMDLRAKLDNVYFHYAKKWPDIQQASAFVRLHHATLQVQMRAGQLMGIPLKHFKAQIVNVAHPNLSIVGISKLSFQQGLQLMERTHLLPLHFLKWRDAGIILSDLLDLHLNMIIPIYTTSESVNRVQGEILIHHGLWNLKHWGIQLKHIQGQLSFLNSEITAHHITAQDQTGQPVVLNLHTCLQDNDMSILHMNVLGRLQSAYLRKYLSFPGVDALSGSAQYHLLFKMNMGGEFSEQSQLMLTSDLLGMRVDLPKPFYKDKHSIREVQINLFCKNNKPDTLSVHYQNKKEYVDVIGLFYQKKHHHRVYLHAPRLFVRGEFDRMDVFDWRSLISQKEGRKGVVGVKNTIHIDHLTLSIHRLLFRQQELLRQVHLGVRVLASKWLLNIRSPSIIGHMMGGFSDHWLTAHFSRFYWSPVNEPQRSFLQSAQLLLEYVSHFSQFNLWINDFQYAAKLLGRLRFKTSVHANKLVVDQLGIDNHLFSLTAKGHFQIQQALLKGHVSGLLKTHVMGRLLSYIGFPDLLEGEKGHFRFLLDWNVTSVKTILKHLKGKLAWSLSEGRILHISKKTEKQLAITRLLNIFNLFRLPAYVVEFNKGGMSFHSFKGDCLLRDGMVIVKDSALSGDFGWIHMLGRMDLFKEQYDLWMTVMPDLTSSLPFLAGITGGPLVGFFIWVMNKIVAPKLSRAISMRYHLIGSWRHPNILKGQSR